MDFLHIGFLGIGGLIVLLLLRVPVAVALGSVSFLGIGALIGWRAAFGILATIPYDFVSHWTLTSVPMFLLMGYIAYYAGLTESLFRAARLWLSFLPGGVAVAAIGGAAGFSAATGSSVACAAAMGRIAVPEMIKYRYQPGLACGTVAAAGTIGSLIPPSIGLILYGVFAEVPISKLFIAGIIPGILTAAMFSLLVVLRCTIQPSLGPAVAEPVTWSARLRAVSECWPVLLLVVSVFGGLFAGLFTPTQAGAVGASLALAVAVLRRTMSWSAFRDASIASLNSTAAIFLIAIGAQLFTRFLGISGVPTLLAETVLGWDSSALTLVLGISGLYLLLGMFLDPIGIMLLTLPIFLPIFEAADANLIWLGIVLIKYLEIALMTPPVGLNVFVIKGIVGNLLSTEAIFRAVLWFVAADLVTLTLLLAFPEISLYLTRFVE